MEFELILTNTDLTIDSGENHVTENFEVSLGSTTLDVDTQNVIQTEKFELYLTHASIDLIYASINLNNYFTKSQTYSRSEIDSLISSVHSTPFIIVAQLPSVGRTDTIYFVRQNNKYIEYIYVNNTWEQISGGTIDLSDYVRRDSVKTLTIAGPVDEGTQQYITYGTYSPISLTDTIIHVEGGGDSFFEKDENNNIRLKSTYGGLYTVQGFISARGVDSSVMPYVTTISKSQDNTTLTINQIKSDGTTETIYFTGGGGTGGGSVASIAITNSAASNNTVLTLVQTSGTSPLTAIFPSTLNININGSATSATNATNASNISKSGSGLLYQNSGQTSILNNGSSSYILAMSSSSAFGWENPNNITVGSANTANTLSTSRLIWGNSFNGSANITGDFDSSNKIILRSPSDSTKYVKLYVDSNGYLKIEGNMYATGFVSCLGLNNN